MERSKDVLGIMDSSLHGGMPTTPTQMGQEVGYERGQCPYVFAETGIVEEDAENVEDVEQPIESHGGEGTLVV